MPPARPDVYRNRTRKAWSLRERGRVVGHVPAIVLRDVVLRASEAGRQRCLRTGARDVHAWATGTVSEGERPPSARRLRYALWCPGFRTNGLLVTRAATAWFEADGSAWCVGGWDDEALDFL